MQTSISAAEFRDKHYPRSAIISRGLPPWAVTGVSPNKLGVKYEVVDGVLWGWFDLSLTSLPTDAERSLKELLDSNEGQVFCRPGYYSQKVGGNYYYHANGGYPNCVRAGPASDQSGAAWKRISLRSLIISHGFSWTDKPEDALEQWFYDDTAEISKVLQWWKAKPEKLGPFEESAYWNWCFIQDAPEAL